MKFVIVLCSLIVFVSARAQETTKYTTKYDGINLDEILKSDRLFKNYYNCLMEQGRCTPDGNELKRNLPDALQSNCAKCSEKQKEGTEKVITNLIEKRPDQWKALKAKYDPDNVYVEKFKDEAAKRNLNP